jgi:hypothetical protein
MAETTSYNLAIPSETYRKLKQISEQEGTSIAELLRTATRLLLYVRSIRETPNTHLLIERDGNLRELVLDFL